MSDVKVTREHRIAALTAMGWSADAISTVSTWPDVGGDVHRVGPVAVSMVEESAVALALATAEHNLRAAVIADLRGLLSRAYPGDYLNRALVVDADSIELLIEMLEEQQS